ncbi:MAG: DUF6599 family protein, partial [Acidobacteriaceae bacterium]
MPRPPFLVRLYLTLLLISLFLYPVFARAANPVPSTPVQAATSRPLLPETFAGWQVAGAPQISTDAHGADDSAAAALQEYGFSRYESASYSRGQDSVAVKAMEFGDASGAFGAFTFYRRPNMAREPIGQGGAFDGTRVLFWNGVVLVDAKFSRLTPMSVAELRDLVTQLPQPVGNQKVLPTLPAYLPPQHLEAMTLEYSLGPQGYRLGSGVLPAA